MHTRVAVKSTPPYKTLVATAQQQQEFTAHNITGTLLSYYSPQLFHGAAVTGFHSHFLAADHSMGGHVLNFVLTKGQGYKSKSLILSNNIYRLLIMILCSTISHMIISEPILLLLNKLQLAELIIRFCCALILW